MIKNNGIVTFTYLMNDVVDRLGMLTSQLPAEEKIIITPSEKNKITLLATGVVQDIINTHFFKLNYNILDPFSVSESEIKIKTNDNSDASNNVLIAIEKILFETICYNTLYEWLELNNPTLVQFVAPQVAMNNNSLAQNIIRIKTFK